MINVTSGIVLGECVNVTSTAGQRMDVFVCPMYVCFLSQGRTAVPTGMSLNQSNPTWSSYYPMDPRVEFQWGEIDGITAVKSIYDAYQEKL